MCNVRGRTESCARRMRASPGATTRMKGWIVCTQSRPALSAALVCIAPLRPGRTRLPSQAASSNASSFGGSVHSGRLDTTTPPADSRQTQRATGKCANRTDRATTLRPRRKASPRLRRRKARNTSDRKSSSSYHHIYRLRPTFKVFLHHLTVRLLVNARIGCARKQVHRQSSLRFTVLVCS
jgi:hypothetical protein